MKTPTTQGNTMFITESMQWLPRFAIDPTRNVEYLQWLRFSIPLSDPYKLAGPLAHGQIYRRASDGQPVRIVATNFFADTVTYKEVDIDVTGFARARTALPRYEVRSADTFRRQFINM